MRRRVEQNRVVVDVDIGPPDDLQRLQVEYDDLAVAAGGCEAAAGGSIERDTVSSVEAGHFTEHFAVRRIDDHDAILPADEQPVRGAVQREVIPAAVATELESPGHVIVGHGRERRAAESRQKNSERNNQLVHWYPPTRAPRRRG